MRTERTMKSTPWGSNLKSSRSTVFWSVLFTAAVVYCGLSGFASFVSVTPNPLCCANVSDGSESTSASSRPLALISMDPSPFNPQVQKLIRDLRQAREVAQAWVGNSQDTYSEQDREKWRSRNPCRARSELPPMYGKRLVKDVPFNPQWEPVFDEYAHLHRTCMRKVGNLVELFSSKVSIPGCKFVTAESVFGLGNRITFAASVVLYAVLTQRVVLFPQGTAPTMMCEPFEGSSWTLPFELEYLNRRKQEHWVNVAGNSNGTESFLAWVDAANGDPQAVLDSPKLFHAEADDGWHPIDRFFCDIEQQFLSNVDWVSAAGCLYFLPKLYAIPSFRSTLEALFPQVELTLTYVLRSAFLPGDVAWDRIERIHAMHLEGADRRVGIQSRYRWGHEQHDKLSPHVNAHITQCVHENNLLPNVSDSFRNGVPPFPIIKVMITSLYTDLQEHLSDIYLRHSTTTGESVGLIQLTHDHEQGFTKELDTQALVEVICLSLSDELLVTPLSTFGGVAQAYGGLRPWIIEFNDEQSVSCVRSPSVDMCYQEAHEVLVCPYDQSVNGTSIIDAVPHIEKCSPVDSPNGVILVPR